MNGRARYAQNFVIQHSEHEFLISFFEIWPPMLLGEPEVIAKRAEAIKSVPARCVGQIIVSAERMPDLIRVLQDNMTQYLSSLRVQGKTNDGSKSHLCQFGS